jgi:hypothetical protein
MNFENNYIGKSWIRHKFKKKTCWKLHLALSSEIPSQPETNNSHKILMPMSACSQTGYRWHLHARRRRQFMVAEGQPPLPCHLPKTLHRYLLDPLHPSSLPLPSSIGQHDSVTNSIFVLNFAVVDHPPTLTLHLVVSMRARCALASRAGMKLLTLCFFCFSPKSSYFWKTFQMIFLECLILIIRAPWVCQRRTVIMINHFPKNWPKASKTFLLLWNNYIAKFWIWHKFKQKTCWKLHLALSSKIPSQSEPNNSHKILMPMSACS